MSGDKRFYERLRRIEKGRTWVPDGVVHQSHYAARKKVRSGGSAWPSILMVIGAAAALGYGGPDMLPAPVLGFFQAPTTEAAMASLDQYAPLSFLVR